MMLDCYQLAAGDRSPAKVTHLADHKPGALRLGIGAG
jgi:hypothetical protein